MGIWQKVSEKGMEANRNVCFHAFFRALRFPGVACVLEKDNYFRCSSI